MLRVLVFDNIDNVANRLTTLGHIVDVAADEEDGVRRLRENEYDIVVVDITTTAGVSLLIRIVETHTPEWIIAFADEEHRREALDRTQCERCTFLDKPVDVRQLDLMIRNVAEILTLRREVTDKSRRVSHLEVVNEIMRKTLVSRNEDELLWIIARLIHEKLFFYNVNMFMVDELKGEVVLRAFAGGFGKDLTVGFSLPLGQGIVGWVAANRQPLNIGDVRADSRRIIGFAFEEHVRSELGVPVMFENRVIGVIHVDSLEENDFSRDDVIALETIADQMALGIEKTVLSRKLREAYDLSATINDSLPLSIVLVNKNLNMEYVNRTFCDIIQLSKVDVLNKPVLDYFSSELIEKLNLKSKLGNVLHAGISECLTNVRHTSPYQPDRVLNITLVRVREGEDPLVMIHVQDITDFSKKTQQLSLLREITIVMQGVFDRDKLLHLILTSVTAGFAMGFNRAFILLVDTRRHMLKGIMGVGPRSQEEAYQIWYELSQKAFTFHDYLENVNRYEIEPSGLQQMIESIELDLKTTDNILTRTVRLGSLFHITDAWRNDLVDESIHSMIVADEFVTVPLIAHNEGIGARFADNAYSNRPINDESIEELRLFAAPAALALEKSNMLQVLEEKIRELENAYTELERTHDMLIRHEKLAAIGEVSARLAHEIRNPLATIGGFAKSIPKWYEDRYRTIRNAGIIMEEVLRLETILSDVLDFAKAGAPQKALVDINELVTRTLEIMEVRLSKHQLILSLHLTPKPLQSRIDSSQIKQVLINIIQNAINAMPDGGALGVSTSERNEAVVITVMDTGSGIPEELLGDIFDPFFTTRGNGTGLGLSISQRIVQNHDGRIDIRSKIDEGTTVDIILPKGVEEHTNSAGNISEQGVTHGEEQAFGGL